jgi:hypothetical protein
MRIAGILPLLILSQIGWGASANGQAAPTSGERPLTIIPAVVQELKELRINTGKRAVLNDGTLSDVYVTRVPSEGNTYLNFRVDVASEAGPIVLHSKEIRLEGATAVAASPRPETAKGKEVPETPAAPSYTPFDWFIDTGAAEERGESLTLDKAIVQFTIEVPRAGLDDLTLFLHFQRVGTVREIRERMVKGN